ncbi:hypothetical protein POWCR01_000142700, partial [Plasmodium ovale]
MDVSKLLKQIEEDEGDEEEAERKAENGKYKRKPIKVMFNENTCDHAEKKNVTFTSEDEHVDVERMESSNLPRPVRSRKPTGFVKMDVSKLLEEIGGEEAICDETGDATKGKKKQGKVSFCENASNDLEKKSVTHTSGNEHVHVEGEKSLNLTRPVRSRKPTGFVKMDVSKLLEKIESYENDEDQEEKKKEQQKVAFSEN